VVGQMNEEKTVASVMRDLISEYVETVTQIHGDLARAT
jgi:hypothetical protein